MVGFSFLTNFNISDCCFSGRITYIWVYQTTKRMEFTTHNETPISSKGTSFCGRITASYEQLVDLFGEPDGGDGYKVEAHWTILFADKTLCTVYNYMDSRSCGCRTDVEDITDWRVGGYGSDVVEKITRLLPQYSI